MDKENVDIKETEKLTDEEAEAIVGGRKKSGPGPVWENGVLVSWDPLSRNGTPV